MVKYLLLVMGFLGGIANAAPPPPTRWAGIDPMCFTKSAFIPRTVNGWPAFQVCKNPDGTWEAMGYACKHGPATAAAPEVCNQGDWPTVLGFLTAGDFSNAARAQYLTDKWIANVKYDCNVEAANPASPYKPVCDDLHVLIQVELMRLNPPNPPPPPPPPPPNPLPTPVPPVGFAVAPTKLCDISDKKPDGFCLHRSTYSWNGTVRGGIVGTVAVGAPCDQSVGANGFYGVKASSTEVAVCTR